MTVNSILLDGRRYFLLSTNHDSAIRVYTVVHIIFNSCKSCYVIQSKSRLQSVCGEIWKWFFFQLFSVCYS